MFFRFGSALVLVVLISLAGNALEKRHLELRRRIIRQHYRMDVLSDAHAKLRLETQRLGAPVRMIETLENGTLDLRQPEDPVATEATRMPLLHWQRPTPLYR